MQGTEARMRVSSVMLPASSCGTLRSARMNTRWPATLPCATRSVNRRTFMVWKGMEAGEAPRQRRKAIVGFTARQPVSTRLRRLLHEALEDLDEARRRRRQRAARSRVDADLAME